MIGTKGSSSKFTLTPDTAIRGTPVWICETNKFVNLHKVFLNYGLGSVKVRSKFDRSSSLCCISNPPISVGYMKAVGHNQSLCPTISHKGLMWRNARAGYSVCFEAPIAIEPEKTITLLGSMTKGSAM